MVAGLFCSVMCYSLADDSTCHRFPSTSVAQLVKCMGCSVTICWGSNLRHQEAGDYIWNSQNEQFSRALTLTNREEIIAWPCLLVEEKQGSELERLIHSTENFSHYHFLFYQTIWAVVSSRWLLWAARTVMRHFQKQFAMVSQWPIPSELAQQKTAAVYICTTELNKTSRSKSGFSFCIQFKEFSL